MLKEVLSVVEVAAGGQVDLLRYTIHMQVYCKGRCVFQKYFLKTILKFAYISVHPLNFSKSVSETKETMISLVTMSE